jgi:hypothetical protein
LTVGEPFGNLHHGDEGKVSGGFGGTAVPGEEVDTLSVGRDGAERIAHTHGGVAVGNGGASNDIATLRA